MLARAGSNSLSLSFGFREASVPPVFQVVYKISCRRRTRPPRTVLLSLADLCAIHEAHASVADLQPIHMGHRLIAEKSRA